MKYDLKSRRMFLQGLGGTVLAIPFLDSLMAYEARAQAAQPIKRYLTLTSAFHLGHNRNWFPKMTTLPNSLALPGSPHMGSYERLTNFMNDGRPGLSRILNSSMNPFLDKMMLYKGLDVPSHGNHVSSLYLGDSSELAGTNGPDNPMTETMDRVLAKNPKFDPGLRPAIRLGNWGRSCEKNAQGVVVPIGPIAYTAIGAYNLLFNNGNSPESGAQAQVHPRRDVLTRVLEDFTRVRNGRQIGRSDKLLLDSVMDKLSDLQNGLQAQATAACKHKGQDATPANNLSSFRMDDTLNHKNYIALIEAIFLCDISRVVCMGNHISESYDNTSMGDYHGNVTHRMADSVNGIPNWQYAGDIYSSHVSKFVAPLAAKLDNVLDPANGKSFLHNGLMHVNIESVYTHKQTNMPTLTLGSFNDTLPTGYMVNYCDPTRPFSFGGGAVNGDEAVGNDSLTAIGDPATDKHSYDYPGLPYQRFLVTLMQSAGLAPSDYERNDLNQLLENLGDSRYGAQNNGIARMGGFGIASYQTRPNTANDGSYHHDRRLMRYNFHYYKDPLPLPPRI